MIKLTKINKQEFYLNSRVIESIEEVPNTVIMTANGNKYIVCERAEEIIEQINSLIRQNFMDYAILQEAGEQ